MKNKLGLDTPRIVASIIDGVAVVILYAIVGIILRHGHFAQIIGTAAVLAYGYMEVLNAASPGKNIMKVGILAEGGAAASQDALLKRYLVKWCPWMIMLVAAIIGIIPILGTIVAILLGLVCALVALGIGLVSIYKVMQPEKRALWDELAGTAVYLVGDAAATTAYAPPPPPAPGYAMPEPSLAAPPPPPPPAPATGAPEI